jgi:hypothetical protein
MRTGRRELFEAPRATRHRRSVLTRNVPQGPAVGHEPLILEPIALRGHRLNPPVGGTPGGVHFRLVVLRHLVAHEESEHDQDGNVKDHDPAGPGDSQLCSFQGHFKTGSTRSLGATVPLRSGSLKCPKSRGWPRARSLGPAACRESRLILGPRRMCDYL